MKSQNLNRKVNKDDGGANIGLVRCNAHDSIREKKMSPNPDSEPDASPCGAI